jgi:hypothetical protein
MLRVISNIISYKIVLCTYIRILFPMRIMHGTVHTYSAFPLLVRGNIQSTHIVHGFHLFSFFNQTSTGAWTLISLESFGAGIAHYDVTSDAKTFSPFEASLQAYPVEGLRYI